MAQKKTDERFDVAKLMALEEPLTVYLERYQGNTSEPVGLPALGRDRNIDQNGTPGTGWLRDDVMKLSPWLKDFWTGAGTYRVQIVDQSKKVMEYEISIQSDGTTKQRTPPPLGQPGAVPPSAIQQVQLAAPPPQGPPMTVTPPPPVGMQGWGVPQNVPMQGPWQQPQAAPMQTQQTWGQQGWGQQPPPAPQFQSPPFGVYGPPPQQQMPPWNPYAPPPPPWGAPPAPTARDLETEKALKQVQEQLEDSKRREIELKYQQEIERTRAENQRQLDSLREEMRRGAEKDAGKENDEVRRAREELARQERERERERTDQRFTDLAQSIAALASSKRPDEDDRFRKLEEDNRRRDEEHRREIEKRDAQAREDRIRAEIKESNEKHERMLIEMRASSNKGPDPMIEFMKESQRQALSTQERIAQMQSQQFSALQTSTINPMQLLSILEKRDSSGDQFIRNMMPALTGVIELYRGAAENVVGLAGGGPGAAWQPVAEQVISSGKEIMDRYFTWKRDESVSGNKAKIAQAEASAQAANAAAHAQAAVASMQHQARQQPQPQAPANAEFTTQSGHTGPVNGAAAQGKTQTATEIHAENHAAGQPVGKVVPIRRSPTEQEIFGKAYESVQKLRRGVKEGKLTPDKAVDAILQGVNMVQMNNEKNPPGTPGHVVVPVFQLYAEERWADFIDVLLPEAVPQFKDECVRILQEEIEAEPGQQPPTDPDVTV